MKTLTAALALLFACLLTAEASAQQVVKGQWQVEQVRNAEPPEGTTVSFTFKEDGKATVTSTEEGEDPQSWDYTYTVEGSTLTMKTTTAPGTPDPKVYEMRFTEGKLELLEPLPETEEGSPPLTDDREPVWVLVRDNG